MIIKSKPIFNSFLAKQLVQRGNKIVDLQKNHKLKNATVFYFEETDSFIKDLKPDTINVKEWTIKPIRRQSKAKTNNVLGFRHRDLVEYTYKNGETHNGYVVALYPKLHALSFKSPTKYCSKVNANKCILLWRCNKIYWLDNVS